MSIFFHITILVLAVFVYRFYSFYSKYYDSTPCGKDPPIEVDGVWFFEDKKDYKFKDPCSLFSTEYYEAREKFRKAVKKYNATTLDRSNSDTSAHTELWSYPVASTGGDGGEDDDSTSLTLDVAVLPGNTQELGTIVHSSGVHGVEGYAGSAVQLALLELLTSGSEETIDPRDRPTIVMVHGVNPVGMHQYRRCNENNVDLNRNGILGSFRDFISKRDPNIAGYEEFRYLFAPGMDVERTSDNLSLYDSTIGFYVRLIPALAKYGFPALKRGIVAGQYHHPEGLNFGGLDSQASVQRLLDTFVRDRPEFFLDSSHVIWIDVHTGLGPFGMDSVVRNAHIEDPEERRKSGGNPELDDYFTKAFSVTSTMDGSRYTADAFKGYDMSKGLLLEFLGESYRNKILQNDDGHRKAGIFLLQEFGTIPSILVGRALILDNMLYNFRKARHQKRANGDDQFSYTSPLLGYAFYPQSTEWRNSIVRRGVALVLQSMEYSTDRSKSRS